MPARKNASKGIVVALLGVLLVLAGVCFLFEDAIANELRLWQITRQLEALSQPPNTIQIASKSAVGLLQGNGNHCDFFAGGVYRSQSTAETILKHFKGCQFRNPITDMNEDWTITILKDADSFDRLWLPYDFDHSEAWGVTPESYAAGTLFLVCAMRSYEANGDFRCQ